ncbi:MAG: NADPH-dependent F420 reductase [Ardenticatenaceae bacterium]
MKIGILGSGNMGRCLGMVWAEKGHDVFFADKDPEKAQLVSNFVNCGTKAGTVEQAAAHGEVLLHTARDVMLSSMLNSMNTLHEKIIIDCNNESKRRSLHDRQNSHAERLATDAPQAHIVKAFNTIPQEVFEYCPQELVKFNVSCFVCGDNDVAVKTVMDLAEEIGFEAVHCGGLSHGRVLEGLGDFIRLMIKQQGTGPYCALSWKRLPPFPNPRLGGRNPKL